MAVVLDSILAAWQVLVWGDAEMMAYRAILSPSGYARSKVADRMTAATAIANDRPLITFNARDFRDVSGSRLIAWDLPA